MGALAPRWKGKGCAKLQEPWEAGMGFLPGTLAYRPELIHAWYEVLWPVVSVGQLEGRGCPKASLSHWEQAAWVFHSTGSHVPLRGPGTQQVLNKYLINE